VKRVLVTGISGTLGAALGREYLARGWEVVGVSRQGVLDDPGACTRLVANAQEDLADARKLLDEAPDVAILNAAAIETAVGDGGLPLPEQTEAIYRINAIFPSLFALAAAAARRARPLDVVAIGSIADGMPSSFGPVYHASKIALHHFFTGVGPIAEHARPGLRLRLYRPGAIRGPLSEAPMIRLNERGTALRRRRCERAPEAARVARAIADFVERGGAVGTWGEPLSFRALKLLFALAPDAYFRLQRLGWRKGSRFAG
jgi:NAD(P)-dependent dehydrogenase (short-subunit alcohol dehydrogenase family)